MSTANSYFETVWYLFICAEEACGCQVKKIGKNKSFQQHAITREGCKKSSYWERTICI